MKLSQLLGLGLVDGAHVEETFTFQIGGNTTVVKGRENLTPSQRALIEANEQHTKSVGDLFDAIRKL